MAFSVAEVASGKASGCLALWVSKVGGSQGVSEEGGGQGRC